MMLNMLGLAEHGPREESVSILVGPNGSGKSTLLRDLAAYYRTQRQVTIVSNTPHDRFSGMTGVKRVSVGRVGHMPRTIIKNAVGQAADADDSRFHQIGATLEYCGYRPRFGSRVEPNRNFGMPLGASADYFDNLRPEAARESRRDDFAPADAFLRGHDPSDLIWIDTHGSKRWYGRERDFAAVLRCERELKKREIIRSIRVYLERERGEVIELQFASSGQLALISSLLFMIVNAGDEPIVIVDEPENSLHPSWQREYVDKLLVALNYRNATIVIATHAPLVVTGALTDSSSAISVFEVKEATPTRLSLEAGKKTSSSVEEVLWQAFDTVTPANHFVSERIVAEISDYEEGRTSKQAVLNLVNRMDEESFDPRQKRFFEAVRELLNKVEAVREGRSEGDE